MTKRDFLELKRETFELLHEVAWGDSSSVEKEKLSALFKDFIQRWSTLSSNREIQSAISEFVYAEPDRETAPLLFDALTPILALTEADNSYRSGSYPASIQRGWEAVDGILVGLGNRLGGYEWVEPWADSKTKDTETYLSEFRSLSHQRGVPSNLITVFMAAVELVYRCAVSLEPEGMQREAARATLGAMPLIFRSALLYRERLGAPPSNVHSLWERIPSKLIN